MFVFSSRRRHTRYWRDWSSDVCSSDLGRRRDHRRAGAGRGRLRRAARQQRPEALAVLRLAGGRSEERRVGKSVDLGGRRIIKKKKKKMATQPNYSKMNHRIRGSSARQT